MTDAQGLVLPVYRPSGQVGSRGVLTNVLLGLPLSFGIGLLYAWARTSTGSFVTVALCDLLFMVMFTITAAMLAKTSRSRSGIFNLVSAVVWLITMMCPWWLLATQQEPPQPTQLVQLLVQWSGYLLETTVIGALGIIIAKGTADDPFSESARSWAKEDFTGELYGRDESLAGLRALIQHRGIAPLLEMPRAVDAQGHEFASSWRTIKLTGFWVEEDTSARWLTVELVAHERTSEGKITSTKTPVIASWALSEDDYLAVSHKTRPVTVDVHADRDVVDAGLADQAEDRPTPVELEAAVQALNAENHAAALAMAKAHCMHPVATTRADAHRICALASSRLEQWPEAFSSFHELFQAEPTAFNALQLATTSIMAGELLRGQAWFDRANEINTETREMPAPRLRTHYLSALGQAGEFAAQLPHLEWLKNGYQSLRTTDSHLLWTYGMPFFEEFLERSHTSLKEFMSVDDIKAWYLSIKPDVDAAGQDLLDAHLSKFA